MKISQNTLILICCLACILATLSLKSRVHEITNPQWYQASKFHQPEQADKETITIHFHDRRPFYTLYDDEVRGVVANPISRAFNYTGIPFKWQKTPATRQLEIIRQNEDKSCAAGWFKTAERQEFAQFSLPVYQDNPFVAITRAGNNLLNNTETVPRVFKERRLVVLLKDSYSYGQYLDNQLAQLTPRTITTTADNQAMLMMIHSYRADYCFMTEEEAKDHIVYSGLSPADFKLIHFSDLPKGNKRYLICSHKVEADVMKKINHAIDYLVNKQDNPK